MGFEDEAEQSLGRPYRQSDSTLRANDGETSESRKFSLTWA